MERKNKNQISNGVNKGILSHGVNTQVPTRPKDPLRGSVPSESHGFAISKKSLGKIVNPAKGGQAIRSGITAVKRKIYAITVAYILLIW